jgi:hypothetical protein
MNTLVVRAGVVLAGTGGLLAVAAPASAHEKWFVPNPGSYPTDWMFVLRPITFTLIVAVVLAALAWRYVAERFLPTPELRILGFVGRLVPYLPRLLAIHLGVSLLAAAVTGPFPRSARRAILEWLGTARTEATRQRRVATIVAEAAEGRRANQWPRSR